MPRYVEGSIIDFEDPTKVLKFLYFDTITEDFGANYDPQSVRGRSEPHMFYSDSNSNTYSFTIKLVASVDEADQGTTNKLYEDYLFFKSFSYPDYGENNQGPVRPPHRVIMMIGNWFNEMGIIIQPRVTHSQVCDSKGFPLFLDVSFTFNVINKTPKSYLDVRGVTYK